MEKFSVGSSTVTVDGHDGEVVVEVSGGDCCYRMTMTDRDAWRVAVYILGESNHAWEEEV